MHCPNCGIKCPDNANFCPMCRQPLSTISGTAEPSNPSAASASSKLRQPLTVVIILLAVCIGAAFILFFLLPGRTARTYQDCMALAARYLEELDYEQAEAYFLEAIQIDPKQEDGYLQLSEMYLEQDKPEKASQILEQGLDALTDSPALQEALENLSAESAPPEEQTGEHVTPEESSIQELPQKEGVYQNYYNKIKELEEEYGSVSVKRENDQAQLTGVCFASLMDFSGDGLEELVLAYCAGEDEYGWPDYVLEIWDYADGQMRLLMQNRQYGYGNNLYTSIVFTEQNGQPCVLQPIYTEEKYVSLFGEDSTLQHRTLVAGTVDFGYSNGELVPIHRFITFWDEEGGQELYQIDNTIVSTENYAGSELEKQEESKWNDATEFYLESEADGSSIQPTLDELAHTLAILQDTLGIEDTLDPSEPESTPSLSLEELATLLDAYFADYNWANDDILSGNVSGGFWAEDSMAQFDLRVQTKSAEWTHMANILVGTVLIDPQSLDGSIEWSGGDTKEIHLSP